MAGTDRGTADEVGAALQRARQVIVGDPVAVFIAVVLVVLAYDLVTGLATGGFKYSSVISKVWSGLMRGLVIGLAGVGLSMTYSILSFANFAHGDYISVSAFTGWGVTYLIAGLGSFQAADLFLVGAGGNIFGSALNIAINTTPVAVVVGMVAAGGVGIATALGIDRGVFKPLRDQDGITLLIASVGVAFALRYLIVFVFTQRRRGTTNPQEAASWSVYLIDGTLSIRGHDLVLLAVSVGLMLGVHFLLQQTKLGKAMRAMADNEDLARITGIPTERVVTFTWIVGGGLAGVAGYVLVLWKGTMSFQLGWVLLLLIFAAVILGGIGSIYGAIFGGIVIGLARDLSVLWIPSEFARATAFAVMIVILLYRPEGIFGGTTTA
jgi:branched-chain amino acid transport system permease protein